MNSLYPILAIIAAYFIGNISPAILIGKMMMGIDIRSKGSGNAGATNTLRVLGKKAAIATLVIDVLKGVAAVLIGKYIGGQDLAMACGMAVFIGHIWPMIFGFRGGKGIATAFGTIVTIEPLLGLIYAIIGLSTVAITRKVSVGSLATSILFPVIAYFFDPKYLLWATAMAAIILFKHRMNIKRLFKGEEPNLSFKKQEDTK